MKNNENLNDLTLKFKINNLSDKQKFEISNRIILEK